MGASQSRLGKTKRRGRLRLISAQFQNLIFHLMNKTLISLLLIGGALLLIVLLSLVSLYLLGRYWVGSSKKSSDDELEDNTTDWLDRSDSSLDDEEEEDEPESAEGDSPIEEGAENQREATQGNPTRLRGKNVRLDLQSSEEQPEGQEV